MLLEAGRADGRQYFAGVVEDEANGLGGEFVHIVGSRPGDGYLKLINCLLQEPQFFRELSFLITVHSDPPRAL